MQLKDIKKLHRLYSPTSRRSILMRSREPEVYIYEKNFWFTRPQGEIVKVHWSVSWSLGRSILPYKALFLRFLTGRLTGHLVGRLMPSTQLTILLSFRCVPQCVAVIGLASILLTILAVRFAVRSVVRYYLIRPVLLRLSAVRLVVRFVIH